MMTDHPPEPRQREQLTDWQRKTLAQLVRSFRRDGANAWDMPGIIAAIVRGEQVADSGVQLAAAALAAAANPTVKTPGWIPVPGRHWPDLGDGDRQQPTRLATDVPCPDHEGQTMPCPDCRAESRPPTDDDLAAARAAVRAGLERRDEQERRLERRRAAAGRSEAGEPAGGPGGGGDAACGSSGGAPGSASGADTAGPGAHG